MYLKIVDTQGNSSMWKDDDRGDFTILSDGFYQSVLPVGHEDDDAYMEWFHTVIPVETSVKEGYENYIRFYLARTIREMNYKFGW